MPILVNLDTRFVEYWQGVSMQILHGGHAEGKLEENQLPTDG